MSSDDLGNKISQNTENEDTRLKQFLDEISSSTISTIPSDLSLNENLSKISLPKTASFSELESVNIPDNPSKFDFYTITPNPIHHKLSCLVDEDKCCKIASVMNYEGDVLDELGTSSSDNSFDIISDPSTSRPESTTSKPYGGVAETVNEAIGCSIFDTHIHDTHQKSDIDQTQNSGSSSGSGVTIVSEAEKFINENHHFAELEPPFICREMIEEVISHHYGPDDSKNAKRTNIIFTAMSKIDIQSIWDDIVSATFCEHESQPGSSTERTSTPSLNSYHKICNELLQNIGNKTTNSTDRLRKFTKEVLDSLEDMDEFEDEEEEELSTSQEDFESVTERACNLSRESQII